MLHLELGVRDMMTDNPGLLPELTCSFLRAAGCGGERKALKAVWTEEMALKRVLEEDQDFAEVTRRERFPWYKK